MNQHIIEVEMLTNILAGYILVQLIPAWVSWLVIVIFVAYSTYCIVDIHLWEKRFKKERLLREKEVEERCKFWNELYERK
jgi:hypothetical protein